MIDGLGNAVTSGLLVEYQIQTGEAFAVPISNVGSGRVIIVYNSTLDAMRIYVSANGVWH